MNNHIIIKYLKTLGYEINEFNWYRRLWLQFLIGSKKFMILNDELYRDLDTNPITHEWIKIDMTTEQTIRQAIDQ